MEMSENNEKQSGPVEGEYKGKPTLTLNPGERFPFSFGLSKAKLILVHLETIKQFVEKYDK